MDGGMDWCRRVKGSGRLEKKKEEKSPELITIKWCKLEESGGQKCGGGGRAFGERTKAAEKEVIQIKCRRGKSCE